MQHKKTHAILEFNPDDLSCYYDKAKEVCDKKNVSIDEHWPVMIEFLKKIFFANKD